MKKSKVAIRNNPLDTAVKIYRILLKSVPRWEILQNICNELRENYKLLLVSIDIVEKSNPLEITPAAFSGNDSKYLYLQDMRNNPELKAAMDKTTCYVPLVGKSAFSDSWKQTAYGYGIKSVLVIPLTVNKRIKGILCLYSAYPEDFSNEEISFFEKISMDIAKSMAQDRKEPSRLIQKDLLNRLSIQKKKDMILNQFSKGIIQSLSANEIIDFVLESLHKALSPDLIIIFLEEKGFLRVKRVVSYSSDVKWASDYPLKIGECLCGRAAASGKAVYSPDIFHDKKCTVNSCKMSGARSFAAVPIVIKGKNLGIIGISSREYRDFEEFSTFLETLGGQFAIGLENAGLFSQVKDKAEQLEKELEVKTILLREIHHRVKNNLNIIASLLNLQMHEVESGKDAKTAFAESRNRIYAMSQVHEKLYETDNFSEIEMKSYIANVTDELVSTYNIEKKITLDIDADPLYFDINTAIPFGLILNEIVSNSIKHAFPDNYEGRIKVTLKKNKNTIVFIVKDNGIGIPSELDPTSSDSLGLTLIQLLSEQLDGSISISGENGTEIKILFPQPTFTMI